MPGLNNGIWIIGPQHQLQVSESPDQIRGPQLLAQWIVSLVIAAVQFKLSQEKEGCVSRPMYGSPPGWWWFGGEGEKAEGGGGGGGGNIEHTT